MSEKEYPIHSSSSPEGSFIKTFLSKFLSATGIISSIMIDRIFATDEAEISSESLYH